MIVSSEYEDDLCFLDLVWLDLRVDLEMVGCEHFHLEMKFWLHTLPQLPWRYEPVPEELIQKVMANIKVMAERERQAEAMAEKAQKGRIPLD